MMMKDEKIPAGSNEVSGDRVSQPVSPKVLPYSNIKRTGRATGRPLPKFTEGELIPWKGVWFQLEGIVPGDDGIARFILKPKVS